MSRKNLLGGALFGIFGIILGAFAAHGLENQLSADSLATFETGVKYQMYNALFLLLIGSMSILSKKTGNLCFYLTTAGVLLFSGSIYLLATNSLTSFDFRVIALATPLGGLLMISGWVSVLIGVAKLKKK